MKVRFSAVEEFLSEIAQERDAVEGRIVRITRRYEPTKTQPLMLLFIQATAVVRGVVIDLRHLIGQYMDIPDPQFRDETNQKVEAQAEAIIQRLRDAMHDLGLEVRSGYFEP